MGAVAARTFASMGVHIGEEIRKRAEAKKISNQEIATCVGVHRNTVPDIFNGISVDSLRLRKLSKLIGFNFLRMLADDLDAEEPSLSVTAEPSASYQASVPTRSPLRVVIEIDPNDEASKSAAIDMANRLHGLGKKE